MRQAGAADRCDRGDDCGPLRTGRVSVVARSRDAWNACVVEVAVQRPQRRRLGRGITVRDHVRTEVSRGVFCGREVVFSIVCLNQQDLAVRTRSRDHVDVERYFDCPARVGCRVVAGLSILVDLTETSARDGTRRQTERGSVHGEIARRVGIVVCINDRDGLADTTDVRRQTIRVLYLARCKTDRRLGVRTRRERVHLVVG